MRLMMSQAPPYKRNVIFANAGTYSPYLLCGPVFSCPINYPRNLSWTAPCLTSLAQMISLCLDWIGYRPSWSPSHTSTRGNLALLPSAMMQSFGGWCWLINHSIKPLPIDEGVKMSQNATCKELILSSLLCWLVLPYNTPPYSMWCLVCSHTLHHPEKSVRSCPLSKSSCFDNHF